MQTAVSTSPSRDKSRIHWRSPELLAWLIVLLGGVLRFMQLEQIRYGYDHSYPAYQALGLLDAGIWPIVGQPSSVFLDNPVLMPYLQAIPLLVSRSPLAVQVFILVFNTAAIWFVYRAGRDILGTRVGLIAALLFAVSPWVVYFSRATWVQSLVPFFMTVGAWGLWPAFVDDDAPGWRFLVGSLALIAMTQTYVQAWGVLPGVVVLLILFRRRLPRRALLAASAIFIVTTLIYAAGLLSDGAANAAKLQSFATGGGFRLTAEGAQHALRLVNGLEFATAQAGGSAPGSFWQAATVAAVLGLGAALATGIVLALLALRQAGRTQRLAAVLLVWLGMPVLLTVVAGAQEVHPHYLLLTLPAGQMLAAWALSSLCTCRTYTVVVVGFLLLVGAGFAHDLARANDAVAANPVWPGYDGWSLGAASALGQAVAPQLDAPVARSPVLLAAEGDSALLSGMTGRYVRTVSDVSWPDFVLLPATGTLTYVVEGANAVPHWLQPYFATSGVTVTPALESTFTLHTTAVGSDEIGAANPAMVTGWTTESGLTLIDHRLEGSARYGEAVDLTLVWRMDELSPDRGQWFIASNVHLLNARGQLLSNVGSHGRWAYRMNQGDVYVERLSIPIPDSADSGEHTLSIGLNDPVRGVDYTMFNQGQPVARFEIPIAIRRQYNP